MPDLFQNLPDRLERLTLSMEPYHSDEIAAALHTIAPDIYSWVPNLKALLLVGWEPYSRTFLGQSDLATLQTILAEAGILFVSRPRQWEREEIFALDYVEQDWSWIQPMYQVVDRDEEEWRWVEYNGGPPDFVDDCCFGMKDDGDWCRIHTYDEENEPCAAGDMVMDQYMTEQPLWYWDELRSG